MTTAVRPSLDHKTAQFVEEFGLMLGEAGFPRSVGRVLGLLLVCKPETQSAESLQASLRLSTGSVSTALSLLQNMDLVQRVGAPGERRFYYRLDPDCWKNIVEKRSKQMRQGVALADKGLRLSPSDPRLLAMRAFYVQLVGLFQQL